MVFFTKFYEWCQTFGHEWKFFFLLLFLILCVYHFKLVLTEYISNIAKPVYKAVVWLNGDNWFEQISPILDSSSTDVLIQPYVTSPSIDCCLILLPDRYINNAQK